MYRLIPFLFTTRGLFCDKHIGRNYFLGFGTAPLEIRWPDGFSLSITPFCPGSFMNIDAIVIS